MRKSLLQYDSAQLQHALEETLRRGRILFLILTPLNLWYVNAYWNSYQWDSQPGAHEWANTIGWVHFMMAVSLLLSAIAIHYLLRQQVRSPLLTRVLVAIPLLLCLCFATGFSVADQIYQGNTGNTTTFVIINLLVAMTILIPPVWGCCVFLASYLGIYIFLPFTVKDPIALVLARNQDLGAIVMCASLSVLGWQRFWREAHLRNELTDALEKLSSSYSDLATLAAKDSLTGLLVRREFHRLAQAEMLRAARAKTDVSLLIVDLDYFKKINDTYGHPAGDAVLIQVSDIIRKCLRETDVVARMGGEEFIALLANSDQGGAIVVAEKLRREICAEPLKLPGGVSLRVQASIGVTRLPFGEGFTLDDLYAAADQALYAAKQNGRNRVEFCAVSIPQSAGPAGVQ